MADGNTKYVVKLPGDLELRVELKDRPVDFEIVFNGAGTVTFHREKGPSGEGKVDVGRGLVRTKLRETDTAIWWSATREATDGVASFGREDGDGGIEFSDPGM